jgi:UDP-2,3-diacylglucosamine pyrophosphatase LpxH
LNAIHQTADGRKFLVLHGDEFDSIVCHNKNLAYIGSEAYEVLLVVNRWFNALRIRMGYKYWSLSAYIKHKVKNIVSFMDNYRHILSLEAQKRKVDGVICGHIHHANISEMEFGKTYGNCGDWVESCTALVEDFAGQISLVHWLEQHQALLDAQFAEQPDYAKAA